MKNRNLHEAKKAKNDEFYTQYEDIEKEVKNYNLEGIWIYCSCDDYRWSNFVKYFKDNFQELKIRHLTATNYDIGEGAYRYDFDGREEIITPLEGNGDFRSEECIELFKEADVVVSNPPFSLFREYVAQLMEYGKKFLIIGNGNAVTYKEIFPLIKENKLWLGAGKGMGGKAMEFIVPEDKYDSTKGCVNRIENGLCYVGVMMCTWFTNIEHNKRHEPIDLYKKYNAEEYPKYDNYLGFECSKVANIPIDEYIEIEIDVKDYPKWKAAYGDDVEIIEEYLNGNIMKIRIHNPIYGVPISFLDKYCHEQFEIVSFRKGEDGKDLVFTREMEEEFNESIKKKRFNRTFVSLFDFDTRDDKKCGRQSEWENYLRENNNKKNKVEEPIDYFFPNAMNVGGLMNNPKDTTILGKSRYARILIRAKH